MTRVLHKKLEQFARDNEFLGRGALSVALVVTRKAREYQFPLNPEEFVTPGGGQVSGLGRASVQNILKDHDIDRVLAEEGGRTSRKSLGNMRSYVNFLNELHYDDLLTLPQIENWWVDRVQESFRAKPFLLRMDASKTLRSLVVDLLLQARKRQDEQKGVMVMGAVMQHLVGAKLEQALPDTTVNHNGTSVADSPTGRPGDFHIQSAAIHVTTAPTERLIKRCRSNLDARLTPFIVTIDKGVDGAESLATEENLLDRIEVFEISRFVAANVAELSAFSAENRPIVIRELFEKYNRIVDQCESDPSLKVAIT